MYWQLRCRASRKHEQRALTGHAGGPEVGSRNRNALLREASETCSPCCAKLLGVPWARPSNAVAVESLVLLAALTTTSINLTAR